MRESRQQPISGSTGFSSLAQFWTGFRGSFLASPSVTQASLLLIDCETNLPSPAFSCGGEQEIAVRVGLAWEMNPQLGRQLARGEHVHVQTRVAADSDQSGSGSSSLRGPDLVCLPVLFQSQLEAVVCLQMRQQGKGPSSAELMCLLQLCEHAAPEVARLRPPREQAQSWNAPRKAQVVVIHQRLPEAPESAVFDEAEELAAVGAIKSHMISNIAHELRSPLVAIRGYSRMLLEGRAGPVNTSQKEYLSIISDNTNRIVNLLNQLVRFVSAEDLRLAAFDLRQVYRQALARARKAQGGEIDVVEQIPDQAFTVVGDRQKLAEAFDELLRTAIASAGAQPIVVEFSRGEDSETVVKILYSAQAGDSASESLLSSAQDIIRMHGGRISSTGKAGEASLLVFELPSIKVPGLQEVSPRNDQASRSSSGR